jgi:hypothetical protein
MFATLSGPIVLENPDSLPDKPYSIQFNGQMWLDMGCIVTGKFHYYNATDISFNQIDYYCTKIHVNLFISYLFSSVF